MTRLKTHLLRIVRQQPRFFNTKSVQQFFRRNVVLNYTRFDSWFCEDIEELESPIEVVNSDHLSASIDSTKCLHKH